MIGIYKITNKINGKCYIGQSQNIERRWYDHKLPSKWNNPDSQSYNYPLYRAFRKYRIENFTFDIIEECSIDELNMKEIYWIEYYNSYNEGYNQTYGGDGTLTNNKSIYQYDLFGNFIKEYSNISVAAEQNNTTITNIMSSITHRHNQYQANGYQWSFDKKECIGHPPFYTPVICFDLDGNYIEKYFCLYEAQKNTGCEVEQIKKSCEDHQIHSKKYQWRYYDENPMLKQVPAISGYTDKKEVLQYDLQGNFIKVYNSLSEAANINKIQYTNISQVCHKHAKSAGGFIWRFSDDNTPVIYIRNYKAHSQTKAVIQYDLNDNYIASYSSIKEASIAVGHPTTPAYISYCCKGKQKTAFGYKWRYKDECIK